MSLVRSGTNEIRNTFLDFYQGNGHTAVPSSSLVPLNDPTLLFTNAGMVPFKNVFTGAETRDYVRAVSAQKCVRAGGKHNDLDNVGYTARHHTFFEMLGNFSFGDYFKEQAISLAWELMIKEFGLDPKRLLVTVYHEDDEAFTLWKKIAGFSDDKIIRIRTSDNFWSMGDTGPCGPCSEIFYDHGENIAGGPPGTPDEDGDRFIEIWNLVFMQYEQHAGGTRTDLPRPSIDTGMGLERISAVLQGVHDNYDIDTFRRLIDASNSVTGAAETDKTRASHRVIADHLRATSFLIADGVLPSSEGRGYVLRRILRRAMRHGHMLGAKDLVMHRLVPTLIAEMGEAYPELGRAKALIEETLKHEEIRFRSMLNSGLRLLDDEIARIGSNAVLPGSVAFKLYDTFGFPLDLTQDALREQGRSVDVAGFNTAMEEQRQRARAAWTGSGDTGTEKIWFDIYAEHGATEFLGYAGTSAEAAVVALVQDGAQIKDLTAGEEGFAVVNQSPFYGESGGQVGDSGTLTFEGGAGQVLDTQKLEGGVLVHRVKIENGTLSVGKTVHLSIDVGRRDKIRTNHSATHLLHAVLRRCLGDHVTQKGSLVSPDRLRFDISHPKAISLSDLRQIERDVNILVRANTPVETRLLSYDEAVEGGAVALFGEKYGDEVRVLLMGQERCEHAGHSHFSVELCGGTHVKATGDIGLFVITNEGAVSSGVRRIEALTGAAAFQYLSDERDKLHEAATALKAGTDSVTSRVLSLVAERKSLERDLTEARKKLALSSGKSGHETSVKNVNGYKFLGQILEGIHPKELRGLADEAKKQLDSGIVAFVAVNEGKAALLVGVTGDLTNKISAVDLVRAGVVALGGKGGGGRPDMAQAGGPDASGATDALLAIEEYIAGIR